MRRVESILVLVLAAMALQGRAQVPLRMPASDQGTWAPPPADGRAWHHPETKLSFPGEVNSYLLKGVLNYADGSGHLLRYESTGEHARADIFIFKHQGASATEEDRKHAIAQELSQVLEQLKALQDEGSYKDLKEEEALAGQIPLWKSDPVPIQVRKLSATKVVRTADRVIEAETKFWVGVTLFNGYLITLRHQRPADQGEAGEQGMKQIVEHFFQIIRDPALRVEIQPKLAEYLASPLSDAGGEAATILLGYLKETALPISVPAPPVTTWAEVAEKTVPGAGTHLLRGFVLGSAKAAFEDKGATECLQAATAQLSLIYRELLKQYPGLKTSDLDALAAAADKGQGALWLGKKVSGQ